MNFESVQFSKDQVLAYYALFGARLRRIYVLQKPLRLQRYDKFLIYANKNILFFDHTT